MPVPPQCQAIDDRIDAKQRIVRQLRKELQAATKEEAPYIRKEIRQLEEGIALLKKDFESCMSAAATPTTIPSLSISRVIVVQSLESGPTVPVHAGPAVVRVFVDSNIRNFLDIGHGPNRWPGVTGFLKLLIPGSPITRFPMNAPVIAGPPRNVSDESSSLNFLVTLPPNLPSVDIEVNVSTTHITQATPPEWKGWAAQASLSIPLSPKVRQPVTFVAVALPQLGDPTGPSQAEMLTAHLAAAMRFPFLNFEVRFSPLFAWNGPLSTDEDAKSLYNAIRAYNTVSTPFGLGGLMVAWVKPGPVSPGICGIGVSRSFFGGPPTILCSVDTVTSCRESTYAHELGHSLGIGHARCRGDELDIDERIPRQVSSTGWAIRSNNLNAIVIPSTPELMGYCAGDRWPSLTTYERAQRGAPA